MTFPHHQKQIIIRFWSMVKSLCHLLTYFCLFNVWRTVLTHVKLNYLKVSISWRQESKVFAEYFKSFKTEWFLQFSAFCSVALHTNIRNNLQFFTANKVVYNQCVLKRHYQGTQDVLQGRRLFSLVSGGWEEMLCVASFLSRWTEPQRTLI